MKSYGEKNIGNIRLNNDDSFYLNDEYSLYIVADGMGGSHGGSLASRTAVEEFSKILKSSNDFNNLIASKIFDNIKQRYLDFIKEDENLSKMGTTIVCCKKINDRFKCLSIGDSRAYHIKNGKIYQLTQDHRYVNVLYDSGMIKKSEINTHPKRNILTKAVSIHDNYDSDIFEVELKNKEYLLLCTDGLTDCVKNSNILSCFEESKTTKEIGRKLVELALDEGGRDNITVVVVKG